MGFIGIDFVSNSVSIERNLFEEISVVRVEALNQRYAVIEASGLCLISSLAIVVSAAPMSSKYNPIHS